MSEEAPTTESWGGWLQVAVGALFFGVLPLWVLGASAVASANPGLHWVWSALIALGVLIGAGVPIGIVVSAVWLGLRSWNRRREARDRRRWQDEVGPVELSPDAWQRADEGERS